MHAMWFEGTIYEAGGFTMKPYSKDFIDAFLTLPKDEYPLTNGMTDIEYSQIKSHMARKPLLVAYEIEPGLWSLNLAAEPNTVICQIDHNSKLLRTPEAETPEAKTAQYYASAIFNKRYTKNYSTKRSQVLRQHDDDYSRSADIVAKDFTNSKYITKLDISSFWKV